MDKETWRFINTFAPWLSAIGTLAAVIVSLYFARRDKKIRLDISAGHRLIAIPGQVVRPEHKDWLVIKVTNIGHREAQITNIGWTVGFFKKHGSIQVNFDTPAGQPGMSSPIPVRLKDGEEATYFISLNQSDWINTFFDEYLQLHPKLRIRSARVLAFTSVGNVFKSRIEKGLREKILEKRTTK